MVSLDDNQSSREHRTTQTKTPARHILTPTPPPKKKQQTTKEKVNFRVNRSSLPSTTIIQTNQENQELQHTYLIHIAIVHVLQILNRIKTRAFKINITSSSMTFDDPVEEHEFNFTDAISKLVNHMDSHHEKVEKQLKMFSKTIQRTTVASGLDLFCRDDELFPDIVSFNNQNLLDTYDSGSPGQFARSILKKLFTPAEMCESILYPNDNYAKPGLDECGF
ncbi:unnamed protein product [Rotaria magnacalcarata]|uniref:Uncharacterized protein n=1 Tax=Rotaria magnacalcarata TaxID=392030 RepID=A0A8S2LM75_9BILA|nr:unnamed protein product [Rotaria magnacalcarata]